MLIRLLNFGTNWWGKFGKDPADPYRYTRHAAYYNSTGVRCGSKVRRHWIISGLIRFNGAGDFNPHHPESSIGKTFHCSQLTFAFGGNRLLMERKAHTSAPPDGYLIVVNSAQHGPMDLASARSRSNSTRIIAASHLRLVQEVMLLMHTGGWVETAWGFWQLESALSVHANPRLAFVTNPAPTEDK